MGSDNIEMASGSSSFLQFVRGQLESALANLTSLHERVMALSDMETADLEVRAGDRSNSLPSIQSVQNDSSPNSPRHRRFPSTPSEGLDGSPSSHRHRRFPSIPSEESPRSRSSSKRVSDDDPHQPWHDVLPIVPKRKLSLLSQPPKLDAKIPVVALSRRASRMSSQGSRRTSEASVLPVIESFAVPAMVAQRTNSITSKSSKIVPLQLPRSGLNSARSSACMSKTPTSVRSSYHSDKLDLRADMDMQEALKEAETNFVVESVWLKTRSGGPNSLMPAGSTRLTQSLEFGSVKSDKLREASELWRFLAERFVVQPQSPYRLFWDICTVVLVLYDAVMIPLQFLDPPQSWLDVFLNRFMCIFWSLDMLASLCTGFTRQDGSIEMHPRSIAINYLRSWMVPDLLIVSIAWMEVLSGRGSLGMLTGFRAIKFLRLARLARLQAVLFTFVERVSSEMLSLCISFVCCVFAIAGMNHVVACLWVGLGRSEQENWVAREGLSSDAIMQYAVAYHWSLTQVYGAMELAPGTLEERLFAIITLLCGFLVATAFVSTVTSLTTRLYMISSERTKKLKSLNRHLVDNKISMRLADRVLMNAKHALYKQSQNVAEEDVALLKIISEPLRAEIHFEINVTWLNLHDFLRILATECQALMRQICHRAFSNMSCMRDDVVFSIGEVSITPSMIFVAAGRFAYSQEILSTSSWDLEASGDESVIIKVGQWACEHSLWTECWVHHGTLWSEADGQLALLDSRMFQEIVGNKAAQNQFFPQISAYAVAFVRRLNEGSGAISDIGNGEDTDQLVHGIPSLGKLTSLQAA